ncbi:MAG: amino acid ABC transporter permease [Actinomycetota bacterium]
MATQQFVRPSRGVDWFLRESTPLGFAAAVVGGLALATVTIGGIATVVALGATPLTRLLGGLHSQELRWVLQVGAGLGLLALATGAVTVRWMPTKLAREESVAGAVLGAQAAVLGLGALWFLQGRIDTFARNFFDFDQIRPHVGAFVAGAKNTVLLAATGEAIGIALGLLLAVFAISKRAVVRAPARAYINFFRGTPLLWQLSFIYFGLALGLQWGVSTYMAAIVAFGLNTAAYAAEVFRAGIQSIERSQLEAARGLGMSYMQAMRYAIVPQAVRRVIPPLMNEFVILIKDTSLVIFLGLTDAQRELMSVGQQGYSNSFNATFFVATAVGYLAVSLPMIRAVNALEKRLRSGLVGVTGA